MCRLTFVVSASPGRLSEQLNPEVLTEQHKSGGPSQLAQVWLHSLVSCRQSVVLPSPQD